jgi:putative hydrolase of the HAD superfamily
LHAVWWTAGEPPASRIGFDGWSPHVEASLVAEPRAVIFDLDDTLYPSREFVLSGFNAVALRLEQGHSVPAARGRRALRRAFFHGHRGRELQYVCEKFGLPLSLVPELVHVIREHTPSIRLPLSAFRVLRVLRSSSRIGVLTNGLPAVQTRKVEALGLRSLVDAVVCAAEHGDGSGKPAPEGFLAVLGTLDVTASEAVFVGDNADTDIAGASALGMRTIHVTQGFVDGRSTPIRCDARVSSLRDVPSIVARMAWMQGRSRVA